MVYERIVLMKPKLKFLKHLSARVISSSVFIFCCFINIPTNINGDIKKITIDLNDKSLEVFEPDLKKFNYQTLYMISVLSTSAIREFVPLIIGIVLNLYLVIVTIRFHKNRTSIISSISNSNEAIIFKKTNINNTKLAFILGIISVYFYVINFSLLFLSFVIPLEVLLIPYQINTLLFGIRHSLSIFILLKLNKKFRHNFIFLMPKFISKCLENKTTTTQIKLKELVNKKTINTEL